MKFSSESISKISFRLVVEHTQVTCLCRSRYCLCICWEVVEFIFSGSQRQNIWCIGSSTHAVRVQTFPEFILVWSCGPISSCCTSGLASPERNPTCAPQPLQESNQSIGSGDDWAVLFKSEFLVWTPWWHWLSVVQCCLGVCGLLYENLVWGERWKVSRYFCDVFIFKDSFLWHIMSLTFCYGFAWQGFGSGGAIEVASVRRYKKLPPCLTKPVPASSKTDPLLAKAKPISDSGSASVTTYLSRGRKKNSGWDGS